MEMAHDDSAQAARVRRARRLKVKAACWAAGSLLVLALWAWADWPGVLCAVIVGASGLWVAIAALRVQHDRGRMGLLTFHVLAWVLGMVVITPLNLLIEWQDNGAFERWSDDSQPGSWDPWVLYIGGVWALVILGIAVRERVRRGPRVRA